MESVFWARLIPAPVCSAVQQSVTVADARVLAENLDGYPVGGGDALQGEGLAGGEAGLQGSAVQCSNKLVLHLKPQQVGGGGGALQAARGQQTASAAVHPRAALQCTAAVVVRGRGGKGGQAARAP